MTMQMIISGVAKIGGNSRVGAGSAK